MDLLDRLLGHDRWTTAQLLERCRELRAEQWIEPFDLGHQTLAATFQHMIGNVRVWTDLMAQRAVQRASEAAMPQFIGRSSRSVADGGFDGTNP